MPSSNGAAEADKMMNTHDFLKAKIQFGNVKGPITFSSKLSVFHHDDIPEVKRKRRDEINNWKKSKLLNVTQADWASSTQQSEPPCERRSMENFVGDRTKPYQYNYRAETLETWKMVEPFDKPTKFHISSQMECTAQDIREQKASNRIQAGHFKRTEEMPQNPVLENYEPWASGQMITKKEMDQTLTDMTKKSLEWTSKVTKTVSPRTKYVSPVQSSKMFQEEVRRQKATNTFDLSKHVYAKPIPPVNRAVLKNRFAVEKKEIKTNHVHTGIWEKSKVDGRSMWSDTGSNEYATNGDQVTKINLGAYNYAEPTAPPFRGNKYVNNDKNR